jgi:hypothetical protein
MRYISPVLEMAKRHDLHCDSTFCTGIVDCFVLAPVFEEAQADK